MELLTPKQVAEILQMKISTVYTWIRAGKLPAAKLGNRYRVTRADLDAFISWSKGACGQTNTLAPRYEKKEETKGFNDSTYHR